MASRVEAFRQALRELGYAEGQNITIEYRWGNGSDERLHDLTADLVRVKVSMIVSHGLLATVAARAASTRCRSYVSHAVTSWPPAWWRTFGDQAGT
jgi:putative ABC transport system substrate-binding protein